MHMWASSGHLEHMMDDLQVLDDVVRGVDEEARGHTIVRARVLGPRVHLRRKQQLRFAQATTIAAHNGYLPT